MKFKTEDPIWEGHPEWNLTEARKYLPTDLFVYERGRLIPVWKM
jgi:hypothetical protein